jgi:decaprenylphospho-beta-D-erythro-pentofuranosid-2-ulose 2-reductase
VRDALGSVQSVLVLGGGSEIARATCRELIAGRTRRIVLAGPHLESLDDAADELRNAGAQSVSTLRFDAREVNSHDAVIDEAWSLDGDIDLVLVAFGVLANDAAGAAVEGNAGPALDAARVNYLGAVSAISAAVRRMRAQGHGTIVVLSSVAAERPRAANFPYAATKSALDAFAQGLGDALEGTGVSVLVVRPGFVRTRMTAGLEEAPLATTPEVVAQQVVAGLRRGSHTVWAPSPVRWLMAVVRHLPRAVFRRLSG